MNVNGIVLTNNQRRWLVEAVRRELDQWQAAVGKAGTDIGAAYCREQVIQCQSLLGIVLTDEVATCAQNATESGS